MPPIKINRKTRKLLRVGWLIAFLLLAGAIFSPWGAIRYYRLAHEVEQLETTNQTLRTSNQKLQEEINRLTNNPAHIEKIARENHGLLKTNEFVYVFPTKKKSSP